MSRQVRRRTARPIRTRRDYERASAVAKRMSAGVAQDSEAEERLKALLRELDRFDDADADFEADAADDYDDYAGPRRRWSDDADGSD